MPCSRCTGDHYNFVSCEQHAAKVAEQAKKDRAPERFNRPREGERDWGDRLLTVERNTKDPNVVYIPRKNHPLYKESA